MNHEYRDYDWLFNEMIVLGKSEGLIAAENGWTQRVVSKWAQIHKLGDNKFKDLKILNATQLSLIRGSLLGDGHITPEGIFIVSHCQKQRDYLFWKYEILKDCCKTPPALYQGSTLECKYRADKQYIRFNNESTRRLDQIILDNIPNELDIVQHKILSRKVVMQ